MLPVSSVDIDLFHIQIKTVVLLFILLLKMFFNLFTLSLKVSKSYILHNILTFVLKTEW